MVFVEHINCEIATLSNGGFEIELFGPHCTRPLPKNRLHPDSDMITQGTKHICFRVSGLDAFVENLRSKCVRIVLGPGMMGSNKFNYISDNSGVLIEITEPV